MLCTYTGTDSRVYMDYRDATTGRGLEVSPGGAYNVEVASGQAAGLPLPPVMAAGRPRSPVKARSRSRHSHSRSGTGAGCLPPVLAAMAVASVTSEEAGDSPADEEN